MEFFEFSSSVRRPEALIPTEIVEVIAIIQLDGTLSELIFEQNGVQVQEEAFAGMIGLNVFDIMPADLVEIGKKAVEQVIASGRSRTVYYHEPMERGGRSFEIKVALNHHQELIAIVRNNTARKEAESELLRLNRSLIALQTAAASVTASLDFDHILDTFSWEITNFLNADGCVVSRWNKEDAVLAILTAYPHWRWCRISDKDDSYPLSLYPLTERVLEERFSQQIQQEKAETELAELTFMKRAGIGTLLLLPMIFQNQTVGLVEIITEDGHTFSNQEISLAQLLTNEAASAIVNAQLYEKLELRLQELTTVHKISEAIASTLDLTETLTIITEGTRNLIGVEAVSVALLDEENKYLQYVTATGGAASFIKGQQIKLHQGIAGWVVKNGKAVTIPDVSADPRHYPYFDHVSGFKTRTIMCMPLHVKGKPIGAISAINKLAGTFDDEDARLLNSLAAPAAAAIDNARLYQQSRRQILERERAEEALKQERAHLADRVEARTVELRRQYQREQALGSIEPTISHPGELDNVLQKIVSVAESILDTDAGASIILMDRVQEIYQVGQASARVPYDEIFFPHWEDKVDFLQVRNSKDVCVAGDSGETDNLMRNWLHVAGVQSYVCAPLIGQGKSWGVIFVFSKQVRTFNENDVDFLRALANRAAVAVANVQLYENLQQANVALARAAKMKDDFLAGISHELRTPLNAILGVSEGLREQYYGPLNEKQLRSARVIEESGRHLLELINDILDVAKLESGEMTLDIDKVSVQMICETSLQFIKREAMKKQLQVDLQIEPGLSVISADPLRLKQILINLLSNAVKFTNDGGEIGLEVQGDRERGEVIFMVRDTGIGIATEDIPRLFQSFVQLDSSLSRRYAGTGLGLALVKRMTEMHGGKVHVDSEIGKGSRFTITIPMDGQAAAPADQATPHAIVVRAGETEGAAVQEEQSSALIMVVDDDPNNANLFYEMLTLQGFRVIIAKNGHEALQKFAAEAPDLILMDVQMPEMDGLETSRRLRALPGGAAVAIIALTALAQQSDRERCLEAGMDEYISKPVPFQKLLKAISRLLEGSA